IRAEQPQPSMRTAYAERSGLGGGFIEFLFGDPQLQNRYQQQQPSYQQQPAYQPQPDYYQQQGYPRGVPMPLQSGRHEDHPTQRPVDPRYEKQEVEYQGHESAGTIVIDTPNKYLFLVEGNGRALRYGIGVGRPGFTWSGTKTISSKREWPAWTPPAEM